MGKITLLMPTQLCRCSGLSATSLVSRAPNMVAALRNVAHGTVHLNGNPIRSCSMPVKAAAGKDITTIEGLSESNSHPVQLAWIKEQVPQCGYCQSGQIMAAAALLKRNVKPTDKDIDAQMQGHICRCGTYVRIRKAIKTASVLMASK